MITDLLFIFPPVGFSLAILPAVIDAFQKKTSIPAITSFGTGVFLLMLTIGQYRVDLTIPAFFTAINAGLWFALTGLRLVKP